MSRSRAIRAAAVGGLMACTAWTPGVARPATTPPPDAAAASAPAPLRAPKSVRRLNVLIVLYTRSFARTLTPAQVARVHEEVAEFYDFYQTHGAGKVDFDFSLLQIDRELRRDEVSQVAPNRYYLSREDIERELVARGMKDRHFDEVIALYAWNNANPADAQLAYGGGAVGPDGHFLGDAGFNSIGLFAWDIDRVGQILIHEVLHNIADMFTRSGMPGMFLNSDEMSKNMPTLLAEHPGAFLPRFTDGEMLAYAQRERAGKASYPWAMQLVYYAWMLERTPKEAWDRLKFGQKVSGRVVTDTIRPLYRTLYGSSADDSIYFPVIGTDSAAAIDIAGTCYPLAPRTYTQVDFDGAPIFTGHFAGGWVRLPAPLWTEATRTASARVLAACGARSTQTATIVQQRVGWIDAPDSLQLSLSRHVPLDVHVRVERMGDSLPPLVDSARIAATVAGRPVVTAALADTQLLAIEDLPRGTSRITVGGSAPGMLIHPATIALTRALGWGIAPERQPVGPMMSPINVTVDVRERAPVDATVHGVVRGRPVSLTAIGGGRYTANLDSLPPGLDTIVVTASRPESMYDARDTVVVYVQPWGYLRVPDTLTAARDSLVGTLAVLVRSRMGQYVRGLGLPLVAITAGRALPLREDSTGAYLARVPLVDGDGRATVVSLTGNFQSRVVLLRPDTAVIVDTAAVTDTGARADSNAGAGRTAHADSARADTAHADTTHARVTRADTARADSAPRTVPLPPQLHRTPDGTDFTTAVRAPITVDGDLADWADVPALAIDGGTAAVIGDTADYHGPADLSALVRFAWDDSTLYLAAHVTDDVVTSGEAWDTDRLNLVFDMNGDDTPISYPVANPPMSSWQDDDFWLYVRPFASDSAPGMAYRQGRGASEELRDARVAARRVPGGYDVEVAIPTHDLPGLAPFVGAVAGMQLWLTDGDASGATAELMWHGRWPYGPDGLEYRLMDLGRLVFVDHAR